MMEPFETTLTGSDGLIDGVVTPQVSAEGKIYQFISLDGSLELTIAKDGNGKWHRVFGTEPYLSGWVAELSEKIEGPNFTTI